jgi:virginiamycin B lyase
VTQLAVYTNIRNIWIDDETTRVILWFGNNHGAAIVKLEPLD